MYLTHHYFVDLIGGSCLAVTVFYIAQRNYLPQIQSGKLFRWHYDYVLKGQNAKLRPSRSRASSSAAVAAWQMNGSFVDLETGIVQGVPPHLEDEEDNWEMQELSPAEDEIERDEGGIGSLSPSTEGSSAGLDSIWTLMEMLPQPPHSDRMQTTWTMNQSPFEVLLLNDGNIDTAHQLLQCH